MAPGSLALPCLRSTPLYADVLLLASDASNSGPPRPRPACSIERHKCVSFSPFALETADGHGASTATMYFLFSKQLRDSGLPADVLVGKLKNDISFCASPRHDPSDSALDAAQHAVEDELALNEAGWDR